MIRILAFVVGIVAVFSFIDWFANATEFLAGYVIAGLMILGVGSMFRLAWRLWK